MYIVRGILIMQQITLSTSAMTDQNSKKYILFRFLLYYKLISDNDKDHALWVTGVWERLTKNIEDEQIQKVIDIAIKRYPRNAPPCGDNILDIWSSLQTQKVFKPEKIYKKINESKQ